MEVENGIASFRSQIDPDYIVFVIYKESERYPFFKDLFDGLDNSIGFLDFDSRLIFIDGETDYLSPDHIIAIQAHEICHYVLQHNVDNDSHDRMEIEADIASIEMLKCLNYDDSANLMCSRLTDRYGIIFYDGISDFMFSSIRKDIFNKYLKKIIKLDK
jgi:hypothetical protein